MWKDKIAARLVPDAGRFWRWFSVQVLGLIAILETAWATLPPETLALIPAEWKPWIVSGLAVLGIVGRVIRQAGGPSS